MRVGNKSVVKTWLLVLIALCIVAHGVIAQASRTAKDADVKQDWYLTEVETGLRKAFVMPQINWAESRQLTTVITFNKDDNWESESVRVEKKSGSRQFDNACRTAVKDAVTPPFKETDVSHLAIEASFTAALDKQGKPQLTISFDNVARKNYAPVWRWPGIFMRVFVMIAAVPILLVQTVVIIVGAWSILTRIRHAKREAAAKTDTWSGM
jgi:hypothetical protein